MYTDYTESFCTILHFNRGVGMFRPATSYCPHMYAVIRSASVLRFGVLEASRHQLISLVEDKHLTGEMTWTPLW